MVVEKCPVCGRDPAIEEFNSYFSKDKRIRRRECKCPNLCSVIPRRGHWYTFAFIFIGDGDDNKIFKLWNSAIKEWKRNRESFKFGYSYLDSEPWYDEDEVKIEFI